MASEYVNKQDIYRRHMPTALLERVPKLVDASGYSERIVCVPAMCREWSANGAAIAAVAVESTLTKAGLESAVFRQANEARRRGLRVALVGVPRRELAKELQALCEWVVY